MTFAALSNQNWLITPAVNLPTAGPQVSRRIPGHAGGNQLWLLVLSGLGAASLSATKGSGWVGETVTISPDLQAPLAFALDSEVAPPAGTHLAFDLVMWAPYAAVSGVTSSEQGFEVSGGFAVEDWRPTSFKPNLVDSGGKPVTQVFQGIDVDIAVLYPSEIRGLGYNITLLGRIVEIGHPVFETLR